MIRTHGIVWCRGNEFNFRWVTFLQFGVAFFCMMIEKNLNRFSLGLRKIISFKVGIAFPWHLWKWISIARWWTFVLCGFLVLLCHGEAILALSWEMIFCGF